MPVFNLRQINILFTKLQIQAIHRNPSELTDFRACFDKDNKPSSSIQAIFINTTVKIRQFPSIEVNYVNRSFRSFET